MPDLINPEQNNGKKELIFWPDELCKSCLNQGNCMLLQAIHSQTILTAGGVHVVNCEVYKPDINSEYYIAPDADMERMQEVNAALLTEQLRILNKQLGGILDVAVK